MQSFNYLGCIVNGSGTDETNIDSEVMQGGIVLDEISVASNQKL